MTKAPRLVPLLVVRAAADAIDFYARAFGANEVLPYENKISKANLAIDGALFSVTEEARARSSITPPALGESAVVIQLEVADARAAIDRACTAGASVVFPLQDFGDERVVHVRDPFGHLWILRQHVESPTREEEGQRGRDALFASLAGAHRTDRQSRANADKSTPSSAPRTARAEERPLAFRSAAALARMVRAKELSSLELTHYFIERIERLDAQVNAVVVRDFERALDAARRADDALARGDVLGPLHGIPMTLKEAYDVAGLATTWGVPSFAKNVAATDSAVATRFRAAGAHFLGKTNVPIMLGDFQTSNELFGTTTNPWDRTRGPGGSSGGSAAALAAGLTALESGSDIGGSLRNPAHFCGVYAHKPTWGIVSMRGHGLPAVPPSPDMAVAGPLARSAEDLAVALGVLAGADGLDGGGWRLELPPPRKTSLRGLRVVVWPTDPISPVDDAIAQRLLRAADLIARKGGFVSDRARPAFDVTAYRSTYVALVGSVMGAAAPDDVHAANERRARELDPDDTSRMAGMARALVLDHRAWLRLDAERRRLREQWRRFFEDWDVLLCPVMATTAFPHDRRPAPERTVTVNGEQQPYFDQVFWASLATLAYLPATVFPFGFSSGGLPIGLQAIGAEYADHTTIELARLVTEEAGGFTPPQGFEDRS